MTEATAERDLPTKRLDSQALLAWYDQCGRHDLPWQQPRSLYRVWLSEIMLQQTQVATVIPYFTRFVQRFPDIASLAGAPLDAVLHQWTGLGYYARAHNLHKAARQIRDLHHGEFPQDYQQALGLPGIGRSTAGAILAQACDQRHAILDGNVKRVLTRFYAIEGWPGQRCIEKLLWERAEANTPAARVADYTQAIMDLGASLCGRKPDCPRCPLAADCAAWQQGDAERYPSRKPRKAMPLQQATLLVLRNDEGHVLLQQRPPAGIWGGLWSLPECPTDTQPQDWCRETLQLALEDVSQAATFRHTFSHFHLDITPLHARARPLDCAVMEGRPQVWYNTRRPDARGLPGPIKSLLDDIASDTVSEAQ